MAVKSPFGSVLGLKHERTCSQQSVRSRWPRTLGCLHQFRRAKQTRACVHRCHYHTRPGLYEPLPGAGSHRCSLSQPVCFHRQDTGLVRSSLLWVIARPPESAYLWKQCVSVWSSFQIAVELEIFAHIQYNVGVHVWFAVQAYLNWLYKYEKYIFSNINGIWNTLDPGGPQLQP